MFEGFIGTKCFSTCSQKVNGLGWMRTRHETTLFNQIIDAASVHDILIKLKDGGNVKILREKSGGFSVDTGDLTMYLESLVMFTHVVLELFSGILRYEVIGEVLEESECPVCLEDFIQVHKTRCAHGACESCRKKMLERGLTRCPICRDTGFFV